ncbi:sterol desaturase family protein [Telluribacter sp.]|jgi:sterol desaturase/sphingolipid hydroxylase (fatty acid hydroxylase superfamily)|uniref:sterol desaturase family protein n=1 Tax=Telluribacter sp. TaxID=1978767 RepID=UPI002E1543EE|nr:sterol desaturase family protein [Telluribacter sp.]
MDKEYTSTLKPKHKGSKQLFENPILERLSRTHISVPVSMYLLIAAFFGWYALTYTDMSNAWIVALFFLGLLTFTFVEYWVHRSVYHIEPTTPARAKFQYTMHGVHHEYPKDKTRLALPPILAVIIAAALFGIFFVLMGEASYAFFPGFMVGYAGYLTIHFLVHAYNPPRNFFKYLWINHAIHHYKDGDTMLGVSSPLWDHVFGTTGQKADDSTKRQAVERGL